MVLAKEDLNNPICCRNMASSTKLFDRIFCRSATHTHSTALKRSDDKNHPVNKFKAGSKGRQQVKPRNLSNGRVETMTNVTALDPALNEIKFKPPHQDIQQLGTPLAIQLNVVMVPLFSSAPSSLHECNETSI
jgi:hypothetical protein